MVSCAYPNQSIDPISFTHARTIIDTRYGTNSNSSRHSGAIIDSSSIALSNSYADPDKSTDIDTNPNIHSYCHTKPNEGADLFSDADESTNTDTDSILKHN